MVIKAALSQVLPIDFNKLSNPNFKLQSAAKLFEYLLNQMLVGLLGLTL